jgi:hypothetical protein
MKKHIVLTNLILILVFGAVGQAADITTLTQLKTAAAAGGTYTIAPGTYTLDADLTFTANITILHDGNAGDVIIDGNNLFRVVSQNNTAVFTGLSDTKRIEFERGDTSVFDVTSTSAATTATFTYCTFHDSHSGNGLQVNEDPNKNVTVSCTNCDSTGNAADGFSLLSGNPNSKIVTMNLINCNGYLNGTISRDQGATCHSAGQYLNITGGNYYSNKGQGIAVVGGQVAMNGVSLWNNGQATPGNQADLDLENAGTIAYVDDCNFSGLNASTGTGYSIFTTATYTSITNCIFRDGVGAQGHTIYSYPGYAYIANNIFKSVSKGTDLYCVILSSGVCINNDFYDCTGGIDISNATGSLVRNNIFHTCSSRAICADNYEYRYNKANGYNYIYNVTNPFCPRSQQQATDIIGIDPQFTDAANGDFSLKPTSPCLNAGKPTVNNGFTSMGAWQPHSLGLEECLFNLAGDLNDDCKVDFGDFAIMVENWLIDCCTNPSDPACVPK